jgi:hypothetical protein
VASDWRPWVSGMDVADNAIRVGLARNRTHTVWVVDHQDGWELSGESADAATLERASISVAELWQRNRRLDLVGYVVDEHGTAWVSAWLPHAGTTAEEFVLVAHEVAAEADRLEFHCSGADER